VIFEDGMESGKMTLESGLDFIVVQHGIGQLEGKIWHRLATTGAE